MGHLVGDGEDGVVGAGGAGAGQGGLDPLHEGVEVLAADGDALGQGFEEEVHEHGLAAPDVAPEVEAAHGLWLAGEETPSRRRGELGPQPVEGGKEGALRRVGVRRPSRARSS